MSDFASYNYEDDEPQLTQSPSRLSSCNIFYIDILSNRH